MRDECLFPPLTAGQILLNNFISGIPAVGVADDKVDHGLIERPPDTFRIGWLVESLNNALYRAANAIHIETKERVIRQQLLFRSGDASVRPIAWHDGRVDIAVTTRDVWTLNPGVSFGRRGGANTPSIKKVQLVVETKQRF